MYKKQISLSIFAQKYYYNLWFYKYIKFWKILFMFNLIHTHIAFNDLHHESNI